MPGLPPTPSPASDNTIGSVLFYPIYTSSATSPEDQNTRISITNADILRPANVHLFFVDGASCSVVDSYLCLSQNQTATFQASDLDPGTTGFLIAVATNDIGCPVSFNTLMGDEYVRFSSGHSSNLTADAALALNVPAACDGTSFMAQLNFNGFEYGLLGRALAVSNLPDRASGNESLLILNRIGGNLAVGAATLGPIFGIIYNDLETPFSFSFTPSSCQLITIISNSFPRTVPRVEQIITPGRSGWLKLWSVDDAAIFGSVINANAATGESASAFSQGHNLHKLTLSSIGSFTIPVFPPPCE